MVANAHLGVENLDKRGKVSAAATIYTRYDTAVYAYADMHHNIMHTLAVTT